MIAWWRKLLEAVGLRKPEYEGDLADVIRNVQPADTPFMRLINNQPKSE